ncbi:MAG: nucleoside-diphosphate-sugar pyrophosphorylase [Deltaproteobacteria bacterium RBG_13_58_19]|nr:MAG: nucleoside-diphosphate-sugar pyrophosphorylase [Deltaproteobacteria bacterium RBG_13_58_19]
MRAVILAGGKGVRLTPLTDVIPKPMVPLGGMPILEIVIRQLSQYGFRHITMAVGYMAELLQAYFRDGAKWGVKIDYSYEYQPLGTAGPLALIDGLTKPFLVMNADVLTNLRYHRLIDFHQSHKGIATIGAFEHRVTIDLGVIISDGRERIKDYVEKPAYSHLVSMGVYVFEPQVLDYIKDRGYLDFPDLVKLLLEDKQTVNYHRFNGYWLDIGRHEDYAQAALEFNKMRGQFLFPPPGCPSEKDSGASRHRRDPHVDENLREGLPIWGL